MDASTAAQQGQKSTFVTVLAWLFIVGSGFATFISILQNIMINTMFPLNQMHNATHAAKDQGPAIAIFMMDHIRWIFLAFLILSGITLGAAIGLLKRKNWARMIFVGIMAFGILWNIGGLIFQQFFFTSMSNMPSAGPSDFKSNFEIMTTVIMVFSVLMALAFSVLFGWIIKRLVSAEIRAEFS